MLGQIAGAVPNARSCVREKEDSLRLTASTAIIQIELVWTNCRMRRAQNAQGQ